MLRYSAVTPPAFGDGGTDVAALYLLHGSGGDDGEFLKLGLREAMDALVAEGDIPPTLCILPAAGPTWYVDRGQAMESAIGIDLIAHVEGSMPVRRDPRGRFIGGNSMGGYGALRFLLKSPGRFAAALLLAPAIMDEPAADSATRNGVFGTPLDLDLWRRLHPDRMLDDYWAAGGRAPLFIACGDQDALAYPSARLHDRWLRRGLESSLRIVDGRHDLASVRPTLLEGLRRVLTAGTML